MCVQVYGARAMSAGMILPAGSPLVQFEVHRQHAGSLKPVHGFKFPSLVWVDRSHARPCDFIGCQGRVFSIPSDIAKRASIEAGGTERPKLGVCESQGNFVE